MNKKIFSSIMAAGLAVIFLAASGTASENPFSLPPGAWSASNSEGPLSPIINPAFTGTANSLISYRFMMYDEQKAPNHFLQAGYMGFSFIYAWYDHLYSKKTGKVEHAGTHYLHFSNGFFFRKIVGLGISYALTTGENRIYDRYSAFSIGLLLRPVKYISIGVSLSDLGASVNRQDFTWTERYSLSVRPYYERLTLSVDAARRRGDRFSDMDFTFGADFRLPLDISLFMKSDLDLNLAFGVTVPLFFRTAPAFSMNLDYYMSNNRKDAPNWYSFGVSLPVRQNVSGINASCKKGILVLAINKELKEIEQRNFFGQRPKIFYDLISTVRRAAGDTTIAGIMLKIDSAGLGLAQIQELRDELRRFREKGKKIYAAIQTAGNKEYYLSTIADTIYFTPSGTFAVTGLKAQVYFFKGLMDKVGVKFESLKSGEYKSFDEPFTREHLSEAARKNLTEYLSDLNDQYLSDISRDRNISRDIVENIIREGVLTPDEAKTRKLVDEIMYYDDAADELGKTFTMVGQEQYQNEEKRDFSWGPKSRIAVVYVNGSIIKGKSFQSYFSDTINEETFTRSLNKAFGDILVRAVVIRVNSGGGSADISDRMWKCLIRMKKKHPKPVVFSFGAIAASGGYYLSCTGDTIFADRGTVTGSIGVVFGKISLQKLYEKLGINKDVIKMSDFADIFSESRELTGEERKQLQKGVDFVYDRFTGLVVESRKMEKDRIPQIAEGRVFTGAQAKSRGLVDEMGGLSAALEYCRNTGKVPDDYEVLVLPDTRGSLADLFKGSPLDLLGMQIRTIMKNSVLLDTDNDRYLYVMPYQIEIE